MRLSALLLLSAVCALGSGELSGRRAPGFSLPDSTTKQFDPQDYRGKLLLIDFMQTDCLHCQKFTAILEQAKAKYGPKIGILSIVNPPSDAKAVAGFVAQFKVTTPILFDCGQVAYSYIKPTTQTVNIPHIFLVDGDGVIRNDFAFSQETLYIFEGKGLFAEIDKLLAAPHK
jgi:thiol-disulfide isomerase/thioredoxin